MDCGSFLVSALFGDILQLRQKVKFFPSAPRPHTCERVSGFSSTLTNMIKFEQRFTYIVQILNEEVGADYLE